MSLWTHRPTWADNPERFAIDRVILRDKIVIARTYQHSGNHIAGMWGWFGQQYPAINGLEETFEEVLNEVRRTAR